MEPVALPPHETMRLTWRVPGGGPSATRDYSASLPPMLAFAHVALSAETSDRCHRAALELVVAARGAHARGIDTPGAQRMLAGVEALASAQLDGQMTTTTELARSRAGLPSTRAAHLTLAGADALVAHLAAADRALGLGAIAAAHTAPGAAQRMVRVARYRTEQTWLGGSDLWPAGADYVPPPPERIDALMDDLVEFCARTDVDPIAQAAVAHAQVMSIQPFIDANGRAARALINGVWRRRGLTGALPVPVSASLAGDARRYDSATRAYRDGDVEPMVWLVARHCVGAAMEGTASAERLAALPVRWRATATPRRGSAAHALTAHLVETPIVTAAAVRRLTGASQASAYDAIAKLADAGVLRRLTLSRRNAVWVAGDVVDEADALVSGLRGWDAPSRFARRGVWSSTPRPGPSSAAGA